VKKEQSDSFLYSAGTPFIFGHRGVPSKAPENTLPSFELLLQEGVPGVELDVQVCASGEVIILHDFSLKRITGYNSLVADTPYSVIKTLNAGKNYSGTYTGTRIPRLEEVFELLGNRVYYDIELKRDKGNTSSKLETKVLQIIKEYRLETHCMLSSFNPEAVRITRKAAPHIPSGIIYANHKDLPFFLRHGEGIFFAGSDFIKPGTYSINSLTAFFTRTFTRLPTITWSVNSAQEAEKLIKKGVNGLISDKPQELLYLIET